MIMLLLLLGIVIGGAGMLIWIKVFGGLEKKK
jgi:hypothetical protein